MASKRGSRKKGSERGKNARGGGASSEGPASLQFSRVNAVLAAAGLLSLVGGYWLLADGSVTAAPLLLVLGYVILLPLAIIL